MRRFRQDHRSTSQCLSCPAEQDDVGPQARGFADRNFAVSCFADNPHAERELDYDAKQGAHRWVVIADEDRRFARSCRSAVRQGSGRRRVADKLLERLALQFLERFADNGARILQGSEQCLARVVVAVELEGEVGYREPLDDPVVKFEHLPLPSPQVLRCSQSLRVTALERALQALELGKAAQSDVDCALELFRPAVHDVGEDTALGRLIDPVAVGRPPSGR